MLNNGFIESGYDSRDIILDETFEKTANIPSKYDFTEFQKIKAMDQGKEYKCVPYSLSLIINSRKKLDGISYELNIDEIYDNRTNEGDGMMIRDALKYMKSVGFCSKDSSDREKILSYGRLNSKNAIKSSVYMNGPCIMALPVYDSARIDFWNGYEFEGGHAIACVGYNEDGFILMNSWGKGFGYSGRCILPYDEMNKLLECWTFLLK